MKTVLNFLVKDQQKEFNEVEEFKKEMEEEFQKMFQKIDDEIKNWH